jgi:hypothetical protein
MTGFTANAFLSRNRVSPKEAFEGLELCERKLSCHSSYGRGLMASGIIYVQKQTKKALSGTVEWHDVFLQVDSEPPVDVSQCDGANCGQPSLAADGHWLVFVRTQEE